MPPQRLSQRLSSTAELTAPQDRRPTSPDKPVYSTISAKGTTSNFYDKIVERMNFPQRFPPGMMGHIVFSDLDRVNVASAWQTGSQGDAFFRNEVAPSAAWVIAEGSERGDIVREELPLCGFAAGAGIGAFASEHFDTPPPAWLYRVKSHVQLDEQSGHTLREYFLRVEEISSTPVVTEARENGLELEFGGIANDGMAMNYIHTNVAAADLLFLETIPRLGREIFADWPKSEVNVEKFEIYRCVASREAIASR